MSLLFRSRQHQRGPADDAAAAILQRQAGHTQPSVTGDSALRHSAVWAAQRLRADLVSTMPWDVFRRSADGYATPTPQPPVLLAPGGPACQQMEWFYSSQIDLDRYGNTVGIISDRDGAGRPRQIDLQNMKDIVITKKDGVVRYKIGRKEYEPVEVWHEKQYTVSGSPIGLSPITYARYAIGQYLAAQEFGTSLYQRAARPSGILRNTQEELQADVAQMVKARYLAMMQEGGLFVTGNNWEFLPLAQQEADTQFLDAQRSSATDIARYYNVPSDLIDAAVSGQSVTYANIGQRNLQMLIMNLNPTLRRREQAFTFGLTPNGAWFEFNRDSVLAMDPQTRATVLATRITSGQVIVSEARHVENLRPYTEEQWQEYDRVKTARRETITTLPIAAPTFDNINSSGGTG